MSGFQTKPIQHRRNQKTVIGTPDFNYILNTSWYDPWARETLSAQTQKTFNTNKAGYRILGGCCKVPRFFM